MQGDGFERLKGGKGVHHSVAVEEVYKQRKMTHLVKEGSQTPLCLVRLFSFFFNLMQSRP